MPYEVLDSGGRYEVLGNAPESVKAGAELNNIPRQIGLTARYGLEGLANTAQIVTEPLRYLTDRATGATGKTVPLGVLATQLADKIGLPTPEGANERVIGDASRLVAGAGGLGGVAGAARSAPGLLGDAASFLSANMPQQLASAAGAGLAGGASREAGGGPLGEFGAGLLGSIAGGVGVNAGNSVASGVKSLLARKPSPQELDQQISVLLQRANVDYSLLPASVRTSLRGDLADALNTGREVSPQAAARLADLRTVGATPTRGMVSQNPVQITKEMNLAKIGANTSDEGLQGLAGIQNRNNTALIDTLNRNGAGRGNLQGAGEQVNGAILGRQTDLRTAERQAWEAARNSPGYRQPIEANVVSQINGALGDEGMMPFLNPTISRYIESFMTGQQPFTPQAYRNLQSMLSNEMSRGGNEAAAAGLARRVLEAAELRPITPALGSLPVTANTAAQMRTMDAAPRQAIDAVNQARGATRAAYAYEDSNPLVRSVLSDGASGDPMRIAKRFVVGGTPNEAEALAQEVGAAGRGPIRDAILTHLKEKALSGASDEVGKFSQSAFNKALTEIGTRKLQLFFSPEEIAQLRATGRAASYMQVQPVGSAVNNSNSGALMIGKGVDALVGLAKAAPFVGPMAVQPVLNGLHGLNLSIRTRQAQNVLPGLLAPQQREPMGQGLLLPAVAAGGLLAAP